MTISLKAARVNAGYTQTAIAEKMQVDKTTIISWEKGRTAPRVDQLRALSGLYNMPIDYIFLESKPLKAV